MIKDFEITREKKGENNMKYMYFRFRMKNEKKDLFSLFGYYPMKHEILLIDHYGFEEETMSIPLTHALKEEIKKSILSNEKFRLRHLMEPIRVVL